MLSITRKTDTNFPGLRHKIKTGLFTGRLYTAFPLRIRVAFFQILGPFLIVFILGALFLPATDATYELLATAFIIAFFLGYPAYVLFAPGKRIEMTPNYFYIGFSKYKLGEISNFSVVESYNRKHDYIITFTHGRKDKIIKIRNTYKHAYDVAEYLNSVKKAMHQVRKESKRSNITRVELRSANF